MKHIADRSSFRLIHSNFTNGSVVRAYNKKICNFYHLLGKCSSKACNLECDVRIGTAKHQHFCNFHHLLGKCTNKAYRYDHDMR